MKYNFLILCFLYLMPYASYAKNPASFTLVVNFPQSKGEGIEIGESYFFSEYRAANLTSKIVTAQNGRYVFKGELLYPTAVRLFGGNGNLYFNQFLFIDTGYQEITLRRLDSAVAITSRPKSRIEKDYQSFLQNVGVKHIDEEVPLTNLYSYAKANPRSYVALFALFTQTFDYGFKPQTRVIASQFAPELQATKGYQYFSARHLVKKKVPFISVKNAETKDIMLDLSARDSKFTFVELWYTGCQWCVVSMQELKEKKNKGDLQNLRIITINTDTDSVGKESIGILQKLNAPWVNYWDLGAKEIGRYIDKLSHEEGGQSVYPTNVLIDDKGFIVARDINVENIEEFIGLFSTIQAKELSHK